MRRLLLLGLATACARAPGDADYGDRVARGVEAYDHIAAAMRVHDPDYHSPLYQTTDTASPASADLPTLGEVATTVDSLLVALASPPVTADTAAVREGAQLRGRLRAVSSRIQLLSGEALSIEEAQALQDVEPLDPPATLSLAVAPTVERDAAQPTIGPARDAVPSGTMVVPVAGVSPGDLQDTFTQARSEGRVHNALDIMAPRGTPVVAATDGRVLRLFTSVRGGLTVYQIGPDDRTVYYYAHLDRYAPGLVAGQSLTPGALLGYVGDTGNAGAGNYHLHFAVWVTDDPARFWDGSSINPFPLLRHATTQPR